MSVANAKNTHRHRGSFAARIVAIAHAIMACPDGNAKSASSTPTLIAPMSTPGLGRRKSSFSTNCVIHAIPPVVNSRIKSQ
ncbi:MAG: hypothetical protein UY16_C0054G0004 [Candidatus Gottesmanbacteria bacterium GW2011_GWA2_47_9]|uniref:Uncharacterized protein n=1 Tax=Candidatus Gottesmanbacteria bacterium GW2011_GWA2_47_9 TaxID=1618445 RepID=A0A0G1TXF0_9BACT|nr:MAG: hypothetical protein UY16_C0054G0004 [Candidatus Gottesmanbacteria bacterium GW2011_GWA2_47_9]